MGIQNLNEAKCDYCGKMIKSTKKQTELLKELKLKGWEGSIATLKCPSCSNDILFTFGSIKKFDEELYVVAVSTGGKTLNGINLIFIPYKEIVTRGQSEVCFMPTIESQVFVDACKRKSLTHGIPSSRLSAPLEWKVLKNGKRLCIAHLKA